MITNAHNKSDVGTRSQRSAVAFSMLCAYTFMVSDRASVRQCGHHPQKGYLCTLGHMVCGKTLLDWKNRMMVPILAPLVPCFQKSHESIGSKIMKSSGHG